MILQALSRSIQAGSLPIDPEKKAMLNEEISQELCTVLLRVLRESIQRRFFPLSFFLWEEISCLKKFE